MPGKVTSYVLDGLSAIPAEVEVDASSGLPSFTIVGLPDAAVQESRQRVRAAVHNSGYDFPLCRITVNLAPADLRKEGPLFDLPIALSLLLATGQIDSLCQDDLVVLGELSLSGEVKTVRGILPIVRRARGAGYQRFLLPAEGAMEAALVPGTSVFPVSTLRQAVDFLRGDLVIPPLEAPDWTAYGQEPVQVIDFAEIRGQETAKRALEVAVAGNHHLIMVGSPGAGKTMLARRVVTVMPPMTFEEAMEVSEVYSICGLLSKEKALLTNRPFRAPHHTTSYAGMVGGGSNPVPGELSLAHHGVLFLDEFPEFRRDVLEALRQPLEDGRVQITRVHGTAVFPAQVMMVAAMNPCPCGFRLDPRRECRCGAGEVRRYWNQVSGPIWDRFDIHLQVPPLSLEELTGDGGGEPSAAIAGRVARCRALEAERYAPFGIRTNAQLGGKLLRRFCALDSSEQAFLRQAADRLLLTARSFDRTLKLARTIADLDSQERIRLVHLAEALQYRGAVDWI
ncbi:MAG: YifB family Mg chelatase-like AAA ATPase [bacterium]